MSFSQTQESKIHILRLMNILVAKNVINFIALQNFEELIGSRVINKFVERSIYECMRYM